MKFRYKLLAISILMMGYSWCLKAQEFIIPRPTSVSVSYKNYLLHDHAVIGVDPQSHAIGVYLQDYLARYYHLQLDVKEYARVPAKAAIQLVSKSTDKKESYSLRVDKKGIRITGSSAGIFYGVQSLIQVLPVVTDSLGELEVGRIMIKDAPRFAWRGLSLDVCRHFFTVDEVKKYIDIMAHYKLNVLHWHLTDDEGWRIQIDKYPRLTEVGARIGYYAKRGEFRKLDNLVDGETGGRDGFYTKDDIREVLRYAAERYVTILPEIEMPGHSEAAIFAYPELGCQDSTGAKHRVRMLDPSEHTFAFLEDVLTEVMALFPNPYIHIGGDEAEMEAWLKSPVAVALMKKEGLKNVKEVQSYFIKRIEKFLLANNRKLIGWNEILEGGLAQSATVMSWQGEAGGIAAAKMHHPVVMTPLPQMYFDAPQANETLEPIGWNPPVSWQMVYNYEPVPAVLSETEAGYILGVQGNIWVEKIPNMKHLEYMIYPRALALSEIAWTPKHQKDIAHFKADMMRQYRLFKLWDVNARLPDIGEMISTTTNFPDFSTTLTYPLNDAEVRYTLNGQMPDTAAAGQHFPVSITASLKDTLTLTTSTSWTLNGQHIRQRAMIRRVSIQPASSVPPAPQPGLAFQRYTTEEEDDEKYEKLDGLTPDSSGVISFPLYPTRHINEESKMVRVNGYLRIDAAGDYTLTSGLENSPALYLDNKEVITGNHNRYVEPQKSMLHLEKGYYAIKLFYQPITGHNQEALLKIVDKSGNDIDLSTHCFH